MSHSSIHDLTKAPAIDYDAIKLQAQVLRRAEITRMTQATSDAIHGWVLARAERLATGIVRALRRARHRHLRRTGHHARALPTRVGACIA
jgi:hypothetical protein